ncbi:DUF3575 domain-containing protein [Flavihumibacter rivuli]|uniref:DUF3575 domain-containing protein n=1 Tax=Flavihumibacter rivuli TaxID=2838156 RepID=UPI001BDF1835|nr:DUF3575 domain-containing protein [Flavihumibacter rivuli]ULQ57092.1 DUF3575 domain-containing protein [Flavihumibacter rivuli]
MKKFFLNGLFIVGLGAFWVFDSQAQIRASNAFKLNPLSLLYRTTNISYERAVSSNQSLQTGFMLSKVRLGKYHYSGLGFTPAYRFFVSGSREALNGIYVSPFFSFRSFKIRESNTSLSASFYTIGGGMLFGWQKIFDSGFVLDMFLGPSYSDATFTRKDDGESFVLRSIYAGYGMKAGVTIGFAF